LYLDEVGWQVDTSFQPGYTDAENVKVTSEANQAAIYANLVRYVVCDPDVAQLNFFGYYDERTRLGWQSALRRNDGSERASNAAVAAAIAESGGECQSFMRSWSPLRTPAGGAVSFAGATRLRAGARSLTFTATATEDVTVTAAIVPATTPVERIGNLLGAVGIVEARRRSELTVKGTVATKKSYVLAVTLASKLNPSRVSVFKSRPFRVSPAFRPGQSCQLARSVEYQADGFQCRKLVLKTSIKPQYRLALFRR
ncbi:MAG: hypothetical protein H0X21_04170, partial [Actinobacteria bacterium]|nr:hypothetical protein [Actinomycetota bacterium]